MPKRSKRTVAKNNRKRGAAGEAEVVFLIEKNFPDIKWEGIKHAPKSWTGRDILLNEELLSVLPWNIEVKRRKKLAVCSFMEQAKKHEGPYEPVVVMRQDRDKWYAMVEFEYLLGLMK